MADTLSDQSDFCEVSVLFSEPKIPQSPKSSCWFCPYRCFSALQRAENSSILIKREASVVTAGFSALQRAENSSMRAGFSREQARALFQCSSASRKFLNVRLEHRRNLACAFQCSSASRKFLNLPPSSRHQARARVSVLFSEPKIPQSRPSHLRPSIFPTATITLRRS